MEVRVRLDRQLIVRDVRRRKRNRRAHVILRLRERLAGQREHQVQVVVVDTRRGDGLQCGQRFRATVNPSDPAQQRIVETLHPQRDAVDSGGAVRRETVVLDRAGVGFERDLGVRRQQHQAADARQQAVDLVRAKQAGCSATETCGSWSARSWAIGASPMCLAQPTTVTTWSGWQAIVRLWPRPTSSTIQP